MADTETLRRPDLPKRFYLQAAVAEAEGGFTVLLDGKAIKTPLRRALIVPAVALAQELAAEWQAQVERIDSSTMPMTRLANTVIDGVADDPSGVRNDLAGYIETDLLFYRAGYPERLVQRQREAWDPILRRAETALGLRFVLAEGVMHVAQPASSLDAFRAYLGRYADPFALAALHQMTTLTGSSLISLAVAEGWLDVQTAWTAAHVDEDWNIEQWGADTEAEARRAARFRDMRAASNLLSAVSEASRPA